MKLLIIILLINCVYLFGDSFSHRLTKTQLRGMYKKELERIMNLWFIDSFDKIYNNVIETAKQGKNEIKFTLTNIGPGDVNYIKLRDLQIIIRIPEVNPSDINITKYTTNLIDALHTTFTDSDFTTIHKNGCEHHIIEW
jgi:hypothetical protein